MDFNHWAEVTSPDREIVGESLKVNGILIFKYKKRFRLVRANGIVYRETPFKVRSHSDSIITLSSVEQGLRTASSNSVVEQRR